MVENLKNTLLREVEEKSKKTIRFEKLDDEDDENGYEKNDSDSEKFNYNR
jgi:hypothetical protein